MWAFPLVLSASLGVYVFKIAQLSIFLAWDNFVGDRILGSVAMSGFLFGGWDGSGATAVYAYVLTMAFFTAIWAIKDRRSNAEEIINAH